MTNPATCPAIGALVVAGHVVGQLRCTEVVGHDELKVRNPGFPDESYEATPHRAVLEWTDPEDTVDVDLFDPKEVFDLNIELVMPPALVSNINPHAFEQCATDLSDPDADGSCPCLLWLDSKGEHEGPHRCVHTLR